MQFHEVQEALGSGKKVTREAWKLKHIFILVLNMPGPNNMTMPMLGLASVNSKQPIPWLASAQDLLAEDWTVLD